MDNSKKTILVVDDAPLIVKRLMEMLNEVENVGWIKEASNYNEAMESINQNQPGILLLDINLPDKSGIDILRACKQSNPNIKIIMITNSANEYYRKLCMELGADHFVDKSKEFEQISAIIADIA